MAHQSSFQVKQIKESAYLPKYLPTYLPKYLPKYLPTSVHLVIIKFDLFTIGTKTFKNLIRLQQRKVQEKNYFSILFLTIHLQGSEWLLAMLTD